MLLLVKLFCLLFCKAVMLVLIVDKSLFKSRIFDLFKAPSPIFTSFITVNSSQTNPAENTLLISYRGMLLLNQLSFMLLLVRLFCLSFCKAVMLVLIVERSLFKPVTLLFAILASAIVRSPFNIKLFISILEKGVILFCLVFWRDVRPE